MIRKGRKLWIVILIVSVVTCLFGAILIFFPSESIRVLSTSSIESFIAVPSSFEGNYGDLAVVYLESTGQTSWTESQFSELLYSRGLIRRKIIQEIAENPRLVHDEEEGIWRLA